jgi:hypothetical protein
VSQHEKIHATTVLLTASVAAHRFVGYDGAPATSAGGAHDAIGVSETDGQAGEAISVITGWSAVVEAGGAVARSACVKPDATGRAVTGATDETCGRALEAAAAAGDLIEVEIYRHVHAPVVED